MNNKNPNSDGPHNSVAPSSEVQETEAKLAASEDQNGTPVTPADPQSNDQNTNGDVNVAPSEPEGPANTEAAQPAGEKHSFFGKDYERTEDGGYRKVPEPEAPAVEDDSEPDES